MLMLLAALAMTKPAPPTEPLRSEFLGAIWSDLELNGMIGNGNWLASLWWNAGSKDPKAPPDLHIRALACWKRLSGYNCRFELFRDGGVGTAFDEPAPDRLACSAWFVRDEDGWGVNHLPPIGSSHSRTTMKCRVIKSS